MKYTENDNNKWVSSYNHHSTKINQISVYQILYLRKYWLREQVYFKSPNIFWRSYSVRFPILIRYCDLDVAAKSSAVIIGLPNMPTWACTPFFWSITCGVGIWVSPAIIQIFPLPCPFDNGFEQITCLCQKST